MTPVRRCWVVLTNTFCTEFLSPAIDSTKNTRPLLRDSPNEPGSTREMSSRESRRLRYCAPICTAQGEMKNDSAAITSTSGAEKISTGRIQDASDRPALNQI